MFGTGVKRILFAYKDAKIKPKFEITDNVISVILPIITNHYNVTDDEGKIIDILESGEPLSSSKIAKIAGYTKSKTLRLIDSLKEKSILKLLEMDVEPSIHYKKSELRSNLGAQFKTRCCFELGFFLICGEVFVFL